jgi:hypothetical protein
MGHAVDMLEHLTELLGFIDFLASTLKRLGWDIENEGDQASQVVGIMQQQAHAND